MNNADGEHGARVGHPGHPGHPDQGDYFANHARARQFPWTLYHQPLERDLERFLRGLAGEHPAGEVLVVGCGLLHEIDAAPAGLTFHVVDIDERAVEAVLDRGDLRITGGTVVVPEEPVDHVLTRQFAAIYAKEVVEHVLAWPSWLVGLRRALVPGGRLWLSTPNYGEPWLPAIESTVLELIARKSGFSRRQLHPTRFSRGSLRRGLLGAGFEDVAVRSTPTRLALTAWARAPR
ncbi:MAG: class I SAM-dependent methyltransferase [Deltaproteobacteria bacterium]|nr:class I SAM-dependent methyltransferase [Deltaproteobacteria bacterium]MDQ3298059.1 class I SAM-dependent methyltransferase [Myxococcota bacterium]